MAVSDAFSTGYVDGKLSLVVARSDVEGSSWRGAVEVASWTDAGGLVAESSTPLMTGVSSICAVPTDSAFAAGIECVAVGCDGGDALLVPVGKDGPVVEDGDFFDTDAAPRCVLGAHSDCVSSVTWSAPSSTLLTTSWDGTAVVWQPDATGSSDASPSRMAQFGRPCSHRRLLCGTFCAASPAAAASSTALLGGEGGCWLWDVRARDSAAARLTTGVAVSAVRAWGGSGHAFSSSSAELDGSEWLALLGFLDGALAAVDLRAIGKGALFSAPRTHRGAVTSIMTAPSAAVPVLAAESASTTASSSSSAAATAALELATAGPKSFAAAAGDTSAELLLAVLSTGQCGTVCLTSLGASASGAVTGARRETRVSHKDAAVAAGFAGGALWSVAQDGAICVVGPGR